MQFFNRVPWLDRQSANGSILVVVLNDNINDQSWAYIFLESSSSSAASESECEPTP